MKGDKTQPGPEKEVARSPASATRPADHQKLKITLDNPPVGQTLGECVEATLTRYFDLLEGFDCSGVYDMVINEVEGPLLRIVMEYCENNQSRAAEVLGLNRGTLRKKLKQHKLL